MCSGGKPDAAALPDVGQAAAGHQSRHGGKVRRGGGRGPAVGRRAWVRATSLVPRTARRPFGDFPVETRVEWRPWRTKQVFEGLLLRVRQRDCWREPTTGLGGHGSACPARGCLGSRRPSSHAQPFLLPVARADALPVATWCAATALHTRGAPLELDLRDHRLQE
eukprot:7377424-Prymnesium_polylepis.1